MMNSLEDELGLTLLVRNKAGVQISSFGQELLADMETLVNAADKLEQDAAALHDRTFKNIHRFLFFRCAQLAPCYPLGI